MVALQRLYSVYCLIFKVEEFFYVKFTHFLITEKFLSTLTDSISLGCGHLMKILNKITTQRIEEL